MNKELYWKGLTSAQKRDMADKLNVTYVHLSRVLGGDMPPSPDLTEKIVNYAGGLLDKTDIRPDLYPRKHFKKSK